MRRFAVISVLFCLLLSSTAAAQVEPPPDSAPIEVFQRQIREIEQRVTALEAENARLHSEIEHYQFLREDIEQYRQFIAREQIAFKDFLERLITIAATVITVLSGASAYLGFKTLQDIRRDAQRVVQQGAEQIKRDAEQQLQRMIRDTLTDVKTRLDVINELVHRELVRKHAHVVATGRHKDLEDLHPSVLELLTRQGIRVSCTRTLPDEMETLMQSIENGEVDILLYYWHPEPETGDYDPLLDQLIHTLGERLLHVPILIYATKTVGRANRDNVNAYGYGTYANTPVTLVTNLNTLILTFGRRPSK